ncbi:MAG: carboxymuconolactone decarboxylase family protein [Planctomycetes bacterium]|nr:carboxymuconolactone decarboxylase family protein [Planctomycetota bacterium]
MSDTPPPPETFRRFVERFPEIGEAWSLLGKGSANGPLSTREQRLVKLGISIGALREGAVHSAARKAPAAGVTQADMDQVVALAATTIGLPGAVAAWTWINDTQT